MTNSVEMDLQEFRGKNYEFHEWLDMKLAEVRCFALEEAAQICIDYGREGFSHGYAAMAIRDLKEKNK